jgi:hypothetical protein
LAALSTNANSHDEHGAAERVSNSGIAGFAGFLGTASSVDEP